MKTLKEFAATACTGIIMSSFITSIFIFGDMYKEYQNKKMEERMEIMQEALVMEPGKSLELDNGCCFIKDNNDRLFIQTEDGIRIQMHNTDLKLEYKPLQNETKRYQTEYVTKTPSNQMVFTVTYKK